jgi:hypothetical protein
MMRGYVARAARVGALLVTFLVRGAARVTAEEVMMRRWIVWSLVVMCCGVGCGPTLVVRHQDPTVALAEVRLDGAVAGELAYGDELELDVGTGFHQVEVVRASDKTAAWWSGPMEVVVEDSCTVTLMTPKARRASGKAEQAKVAP